MKLFRYLLPLVVGLVSSLSTVEAAFCEQDGTRFDQELDERDFDALRDYVNTKRTINLSEKACNLTISGDVRTEWRHLNEKGCKATDNLGNGRYGNLRGKNRTNYFGCPLSRNDFDIEFNLRFDYVCDRNWAVVHLQYDNTAGVDGNRHPCKQEDHVPPLFADPKGFHGSGTCDNLCLKKAYWGYNLCCEGCTRFDIEIGRRNLYNIFDSKIQFLSRFDGIFLKYASSCDGIADWYLSLGGFVVDERVNHFAWATETGWLDICGTGFDLKYSFIWWRKNGRNFCHVRDPKGFRYQISQFTINYDFDPEIFCCQPARIYGAFLINHDTKGTLCKKRINHNMGWYIGFTIGEVVQEYDWAIDLRYEWVEAFAIPDNDVSGIGRGNVLDESVTSFARRGNTNYKGFRFEALYALTDNLTLDTIVEWSKEITKQIGGKHNFAEFRLEAIYAF